MHFEQRQFVASVAERLPEFFAGVRVLEIGSAMVNGSVRSLFQGCDYLSLDLAEAPGVDIVASGHEFNAATPFDCTLSCECFEHNPYALATLANMIRLTRPGGLLFFTCATHDRPEHGTRRASPEASPGTTFMGIDHYRNLGEADFAGIDFASHFEHWRFYTNPGSQDLYFVGLTRGANAASVARCALLDSDVRAVIDVSVTLRVADQDIADGAPAAAIARLRAVRRGAPRWARTLSLFKEVWCLMNMGNLDAALVASSDLVRSSRDADHWWQHSVLRHRRRDTDAALHAALESEALAAGNARHLVHLATLLIAAGRLDEAATRLDVALRINPTDATAHHRLSILHHKAHRSDLALEHARRAAELAPANAAFVKHALVLQSAILPAPPN